MSLVSVPELYDIVGDSRTMQRAALQQITLGFLEMINQSRKRLVTILSGDKYSPDKAFTFEAPYLMCCPAFLETFYISLDDLFVLIEALRQLLISILKLADFGPSTTALHFAHDLVTLLTPLMIAGIPSEAQVSVALHEPGQCLPFLFDSRNRRRGCLINEDLLGSVLFDG